MPLRKAQAAQPKSFKNDKINMLNFGIAYVNEDAGKGGAVCTVRIMLKKISDGNGGYIFPDVYKDEQDNEYSPEQAVQLLAQALLNGGAINCHIFENKEGMSGNARVNIKSVDTEPKQTTKPAAKVASAKAKRDFTPVVEEPVEDEDEDGIPY